MERPLTAPNVSPSKLGRRALAIALLVCLLIIVERSLHQRRPSVPGVGDLKEFNPAGEVSLVIQGFRTNDFTGEIQAVVAVTNSTSAVLELSHVVQILTLDGWAHTNGRVDQMRMVTDDDAKVAPFSEKIQYIDKPGLTNSWRILIAYGPTNHSAKRRWLYGPEIVH